MKRCFCLTIRNFQKGDEKHLAKMFSDCFGPITPRQIIQIYSRQGILPENIFIAEVDGKPASTVETTPKQLHVGEENYLKTGAVAGVCTDSEYRKKGLASKVMRVALEHVKSTGITNASLYTELSNPARRIYERFGFVDITGFRTYVRYLDFHSLFARWIRALNQRLKHSEIAKRELRGWGKSIVIAIKEVESLAFRVSEANFKILKKLPKKPDIVLSTDLESYTKIWWNAAQWDGAVKTGRLLVEQGSESDIEMFKRILYWRWGG